ncbi:MAG: chorismate mutase [Patescibacteria group bacterium]
MQAHELNNQNPDEAAALQRLGEAREAIGEITLAMVMLLEQRFSITREQVGPIKKELGLPAVDEAREQELVAMADALGEERGLPKGLMADITRSIITYVVEEHQQLLAPSTDPLAAS